uniref:Uncharacterized protein n=1 Tax=Picea sitchensis TaxID=3332 RepID=D5A881_PICSI|nr:unknown [Picea sitchensis]
MVKGFANVSRTRKGRRQNWSEPTRLDVAWIIKLGFGEFPRTRVFQTRSETFWVKICVFCHFSRLLQSFSALTVQSYQA